MLEPARDREQREGGLDDRGFDAVNDESRFMGKSAGRGPTWNTDGMDSGGAQSGGDSTGGTTGESYDQSQSQSQGDFGGRGEQSYGESRSGVESGSADAGTAPSYVDANERAMEQSDRPKGRNIQEGGFDDSAPNASFNAEIGSKDDPSLLAEQKFERENAQTAGDSAGGPRQSELSGDGQYDSLRDESA